VTEIGRRSICATQHSGIATARRRNVSQHKGVTFTAFNMGLLFGHCLDGFVIAELTSARAKKKNHYLGDDCSHAGD
jgi:hypothetical protein